MTGHAETPAERRARVRLSRIAADQTVSSDGDPAAEDGLADIHCEILSGESLDESAKSMETALENEHHHHRYHDRDSDHSDILHEISGSSRHGVDATHLASTQVLSQVGDGTRAITESICSSTRDVLREVGDGTRDVLKELCDVGRDVTEAVNRNGSAGLQATERNGGEGRLVTERTARDVQVAVERSGGDTRQLIERSGGDTRQLVVDRTCDVKEQVLQGFGRTDVQITGGFKDVLRDGAVNTRDIQLLAERNAHAAALAACANTQAIQIEAVKNANAAAIAAEKNAAALAAQLAACCCEQKELIRAEAGATRDLINNNERDRLARELQDCKQESALLRMQMACGGNGGNGPGPFVARPAA